MAHKIFVDTNIIIYAYTNDKEGRTPKAIEFLKSISQFNNYISIQVINEFCNVLLYNNVPFNDINEYLIEIENSFFILPIDFYTAQNGLYVKQKYNYKWFDSLLLASALENQCSIFYSEDMHHNHIIEKKMKIINPFK